MPINLHNNLDLTFLKPSKGQNTLHPGPKFFLNLSKGQNTLHPNPKCLFEPVKRTKHAASGLGMSF
ncbi:hypothetical protein BIZ35_08285 [Heyndrickxia coagulans]|nr:hypothetical protein BIZ35_08285 [Heyndrickxia coagulans]